MTTSNALYNRIGIDYDNTRHADALITQRLIAKLEPLVHGRYLDLACGSGNYARAILETVHSRWVGCDVSIHMLGLAREKNANIDWTCVDVAAVPFATGAFDGALCINALHHFISIKEALTELRRVLAPQGRLIVFSATADQMQHYWLNAYFPRAMTRSIAAMPSAEYLVECAQDAGFVLREREAYLIRPDLQDKFLYSGKHDPSRYLNAKVRAGISTFSAHGDQTEIDTGCRHLADDLASDKFSEVTKSFDSTDGDYSFWCFEAT